MKKHKIGGNQKVKMFFAKELVFEKRIYKINNEFPEWNDGCKSETCIYPKVVSKMIYYK